MSLLTTCSGESMWECQKYLEHALLNDQGHQENKRNANVTLWENSVNTPCWCPFIIPPADPEATTATH